MSATTTRELIARHRDLWALLTRNPFVEGVHDGTLPDEAFERWLVHACHAFATMLSSWGRLAAIAPPRERAFMAESLGILHREIEWYGRLCRRHGLSPSGPAHPVSIAFLHHVTALGLEPYSVAISGYWAHMRSYTSTWIPATKAVGRYREVATHWRAAAQSTYPDRFDSAVDRALAAATPAERARAEATFRRAVLVKLDLWALILGDEPVGDAPNDRAGRRRTPR